MVKRSENYGRTDVEKPIEKVIDGCRHCFDSDEGFKRECAGCPYAIHPDFECRVRLHSDILSQLKQNVGDKERTAMVWKPAKGRPVYEKGVCSCGYVLSVLQSDFVYCPICGAGLEWG